MPETYDLKTFPSNPRLNEAAKEKFWVVGFSSSLEIPGLRVGHASGGVSDCV